MADKKQISMAASAIALRGVRLFINAGKAAAERRSPPAAPKRCKKSVVPVHKIPQHSLEYLVRMTRFNNSDMPHRKLKEKSLEMLFRNTHFSKNELESLYTMYRKLVTEAQAAASPTIIGQPIPKIDFQTFIKSKTNNSILPYKLFLIRVNLNFNNIVQVLMKRFEEGEIQMQLKFKKSALRRYEDRRGIDQNTFRDVMHNTFDLVTEEIVLDRIWSSWDRGVHGGEGSIKFEAWAKGLSVLLRGSTDERRIYCFNVYDLNSDGFITKDEMFILLKNSLLKQPGDEDPDEGVRDLVELVLRKMDIDKDGKVSIEDYRQSVQQEPLLLEAFGQCMPTRRHAATFLKTLSNKLVA